MSKYDSIKTPHDLVREVISNGMSTVQDDINRAADILGTAPIRNNVALANSSESISGKSISDTFYFIAFSVWNHMDAVRFYNEHTLQVNGMSLRQIQDANRDLEKDRETAWAKVNKLEQLVQEDEHTLETMTAKINMQTQIITELKAKLYDLMTAGA